MRTKETGGNSIMDAILSLISYLGVPEATFFLFLVVYILVIIRLYGAEFRQIVSHRRNRFYSAVWAACALITAACMLGSQMTGELPGILNRECFDIYKCIQIVMVVVFILWSVECILHYKGNSCPVRKYVKQCEERFDEGAFLEVREKVLSKPWYCIKRADKNAYFLLLCRYYLYTHCFIDAIKALNKVETNLLYKKDFERYCIQFAFACAEVGAYGKAAGMLGKLEKVDKERRFEKNPEYWNLKCMIEDTRGNLNAALDFARTGLDLADENDRYTKCQLNNNIARFLSLRMDVQNAPYQMRWAKRQLDQMKKANMPLVNTVYGNLILMLVRMDSENPEIESLRAEYYELVEKSGTFDNYMEYQNVLLEMFRQSGINGYYPVVMNGYRSNVERLKAKYGDAITQERIANEVSTLRMLVNGNFTLEEIEEDINLHFESYKTVGKKEMLFAYRELYGTIEQMPMGWQSHFSRIFSSIQEYYNTDGLKDVDRIIAELDEYDVWGYVHWVRYKGVMLRSIYGKKSYPYTQDIHKALIQKCSIEGLHKEELREIMLWLDDMTSPEVWDARDKKPELIIKNAELVNKAAKLYEQYKEYPEVFEFSVLLSTFYFILDDMEKSKRYLLEFTIHNIDIHSYAAWYRLKYYHLLKIHGMSEYIDKEDFSRVSSAMAGSVFAKDQRLEDGICR